MTEKHHREECKCDQCQPNLDQENYSTWHDLEGNPVTKPAPSPSPAQAAAEEICAYMLADDFNTEHYQPGWQNIAPIIAKHYAALTEQLAAVTAERDENIMSCEITYDEWKRMQKRADAASRELEELRGALSEVYAAMVEYQQDSEGDAPPKHRDMMARAHAALHPAQPETKKPT